MFGLPAIGFGPEKNMNGMKAVMKNAASDSVGLRATGHLPVEDGRGSPVGGDARPAVHEQHGQQRSLTRAAERQLVPVLDDLEPMQDAEFQRPGPWLAWANATPRRPRKSTRIYRAATGLGQGLAIDW